MLYPPELRGRGQKRTVLRAVGDNGSCEVRGSHLGEVQIEMVDAVDRDLSVAELARRWRDATGAVPGAEELTFTSSILSGVVVIDSRKLPPGCAARFLRREHE